MTRRFLSALLAATVIAAIVPAGGCSSGSGTGEPVAEDPGGPTEAQIASAFESMHPGFTAKEIVANDGQWLVAGQSEDVPAFWIRTWVAPVPDGDVTTVVDGMEWSTARDLQEVTENAGLMPGDMRVQFMQAVVDDVGIDDAEHPGGFATSVSVVSNMDMRVGFTSDTGDLNSLDYVLDLASGDWVPAP
jgi:hypothetical protein